MMLRSDLAPSGSAADDPNSHSPETPAWRLNLGRAARLLSEYSGRLVDVTRSIEATSAKLTSVAQLMAWGTQLQAELGQARAEVERLQAEVKTRDERLLVFESAANERLREIERQGQLGHELSESIAVSKEALERLSAQLTEREQSLVRLQALESSLRREADQAAADYAQLRSEYEVLARELIVLRNESLLSFIRRRWGLPQPKRSG